MTHTTKLLLPLAMSLLASAAYSAPLLQRCAPLEVQAGASGLTYRMACEAGTWKLIYSGDVPHGQDTQSVAYRLEAQNAGGKPFNQQRSATVPGAAKLGQVLAREAVVLDSGELALRDCKDAGCSKYRPVTGVSLLPPQAVTLPAKADAPVRDALPPGVPTAAQAAPLEVPTPADQEVARRLKETLAQLAALRAETDVAQTKAQAELLAEQAAAEGRVVAARATATREAQAEVTSLRGRVQDLEGELGRNEGARTQALKEKDQAIKDREVAVELARTMATDLAGLKKLAAEHNAIVDAQRSAYEFALAALVSQHNEQVANLNRMLPEMNFRGVVEDLKVPKVAVAASARSGSAPSEVAPTAPKAKAKRSSRKKDAAALPAEAASGAEPVAHRGVFGTR